MRISRTRRTAAAIVNVVPLDRAGVTPDPANARLQRTVTPEQRLRMALTDNRATELSSWDADRLRQLQAEAPDVLKALWTDHELVETLAGASCELRDGMTDPDAVPQERSTTIQRGDLFALGSHRHARDRR